MEQADGGDCDRSWRGEDWRTWHGEDWGVRLLFSWYLGLLGGWFNFSCLCLGVVVVLGGLGTRPQAGEPMAAGSIFG